MAAVELYVWDARQAPAKVLGRLTVENKTGQFTYRTSWLDGGSAFSLDPQSLYLEQDRIFTTQAYDGVFPVLNDAGPDQYGKKLLLHRMAQSSDLSAEQFLLHGSGHGAGALLFSDGVDAIPEPVPLHSSDELADLMNAAMLVETGQAAPDAVTDLLLAGTSLGGARPKLPMRHRGAEWIAKFSREDDIFDVPAVEHACLTLARQAGMNPVASELRQAHGRNVLLVKRFDRAETRRTHYLSALTWLVPDGRMSEAEVMGIFSYAGIGNCYRRFGVDAGGAVTAAMEELYRRMLFNILISNTDDHAKNHGFLMDDRSQQFRLAPAFDLVPSTRNTTTQSLGCGPAGRESSVDNARRDAPRFGLLPERAAELIEEVTSAVAGWRAHFAAAGVNAADIRLLARSVKL